MAEDPLDFTNIMYSYHLYTGISDGYFEDALNQAKKAGIPVFVTEWGLSADEETGDLDIDEAYDFISYMHENKISWANWSLCNKEEDYSAIRSDVDKLSDWEEDDLSVSGKIIFNALSGKEE